MKVWDCSHKELTSIENCYYSKYYAQYVSKDNAVFSLPNNSYLSTYYSKSILNYTMDKQQSTFKCLRLIVKHKAKRGVLRTSNYFTVDRIGNILNILSIAFMALAGVFLGLLIAVIILSTLNQ